MAAAEAKAVSTIDSVLEVSVDGSTWEKMCPIKTYPQLGGAPDQLETTDMDDDEQTFVPGVKTRNAMEFTANYTLATYEKVKAKGMTDLHYRLSMGKGGKDGVAKWDGQHDVYVNDGAVNGVREMTITCAPSTKVTIAAAD